jgi:hypothetical protein
MLAALLILAVLHPGRILQGPNSDFTEYRAQKKAEKKAKKEQKRAGKNESHAVNNGWRMASIKGNTPPSQYDSA